LADAEIGAHSRDSWIPCKSADLQRFRRISQSRESAGTLNLHPIRVDLNPNVVPGETIGSMDRSIHEALKPSISGDNRARLEPARLSQIPPAREHLIDRGTCLVDTEWDRAIYSDICPFLKAEASSCPPLAAEKPDYANVGLRKLILWMRGKKQVSCISNLALACE